MKLILGTAQFGLDYGVSNTRGKTVIHDAKKILEYAYDNNISTIDTAIQYGNSEGVIGNSINKRDDWEIITKTISFTGDSINEAHVKQLRESFNHSLLNLNKTHIYGLLLHSCNNLFLPGGEKLLQEMKRMKNEGLVKKIGISLYDSKQIDRILRNYSIDLVQLPINILDQRLINDGSLIKLKEYNIEVHARSVFLQGLLLMPLNAIHPWFNPIMGTLEKFHTEAKKRNMSVLQLALAFIQGIDEIDGVVFGVNTLEQLHEIIGAVSVYTDTNSLFSMSISDSVFLNPSNWKI
jgi:aryl-alcohol dehydrogenase-like predicted oxidoreductase